MPAIDINAAEETQGLKFRVLGSQFVNGDDGSASGTSASYSGFSAFSSVLLVVDVALRQGYREHPLILTVEHSDDGLSWVTADTFSFSTDGSPSATLSSPKDYLRASWTAGPGSEWSIVSVDVVAPTASGVPFLTTTVTLTNSDIIALNTTPFALVAATENLNYLTPPASLPFPIMCNGWLKMSEGWGNAGTPINLDLCWGSDYSLTVGRAVQWTQADPPGFLNYGSSAFNRSGGGDWPISFVIAPNLSGGANYFDNGIYVAIGQNGASLGDLTGGDPDATLTLTTVYYINTKPT